MTAPEIPDPVLSELPEGFGLVPICDLADLLGDGVQVELLAGGGVAARRHTASFVKRASEYDFLIPARITPPAPPEPETEWVPLAECLGREVMVDGERRVVEWVNTRLNLVYWYDRHWQQIPVAPDGMVEVLVVPAPQGEGR